MKKLIGIFAAAILMASPVMAAGVNVTVNDEPIDLEGTIVEDRTLVPVRGVFEKLGYYVDYDADTKTAGLTANGTEVIMTLGNTYFTVNDEQFIPDVPPQIIDGRFMLPLRAVGEALGGEVNWDADTKTASINAPKAQRGLIVKPLYIPE